MGWVMEKDRVYYKDLNKVIRMENNNMTVINNRYDIDFEVRYFRAVEHVIYNDWVQEKWDQRKQERLERKLAEVTQGCGIETKRRM